MTAPIRTHTGDHRDLGEEHRRHQPGFGSGAPETGINITHVTLAGTSSLIPTRNFANRITHARPETPDPVKATSVVREGNEFNTACADDLSGWCTVEQDDGMRTKASILSSARTGTS